MFSGLGVALVTPFTPAGEVDFDALIMHVERQIEGGTDHLVVLGTTAETPTLSADEKSDVIRCVKETNAGRLPVVVGAGGNDTRASIEAINALDGDGIDAILSVVPYYNKPTQEGIYQHFSALASATGKPLVLYNVPSRTGTHMEAQTVLRLAHDHPGTVVALKEASGSFEHSSAILRDKPEEFQLLSGDDVLALSLMAIGAEGVISVIGNAYPELFSSLIHLAMEGDYQAASRIHLQMVPMMKALFREGNPAGVKAAMAARGWISNTLRLPLIPAGKALSDEITELNHELCR